MNKNTSKNPKLLYYECTHWLCLSFRHHTFAFKVRMSFTIRILKCAVQFSLTAFHSWLIGKAGAFSPHTPLKARLTFSLNGRWPHPLTLHKGPAYTGRYIKNSCLSLLKDTHCSHSKQLYNPDLSMRIKTVWREIPGILKRWSCLYCLSAQPFSYWQPWGGYISTCTHWFVWLFVHVVFVKNVWAIVKSLWV